MPTLFGPIFGPQRRHTIFLVLVLASAAVLQGSSAPLHASSPWPVACGNAKCSRQTGYLWASGSGLAPTFDSGIVSASTLGVIVSAPVSTPSVIYSVTSLPAVEAFFSNGTLAIRYMLPARSSASPVLLSNNLIVVPAWDGSLTALSLGGSLQWTANLGSPARLSPSAFSTDKVAVALDGGIIKCVSAIDGSIQWTQTLASTISASFAEHPSGMLLTGTTSGAIVAITFAGSVAWQSQTGGIVSAAPGVTVDGRVLATSRDGNMYMLNQVSGVRQWVYSSGSPIRGGAAMLGNSQDDLVVFGCNDSGSTFSVWAANGTVRWQSNAMLGGSSCIRSPIISGDRVVFFASATRIIALESDGTTKFVVNFPSTESLGQPSFGPSGSIVVSSASLKLYVMGGPTPQTIPDTTAALTAVPSTTAQGNNGGQADGGNSQDESDSAVSSDTSESSGGQPPSSGRNSSDSQSSALRTVIITGSVSAGLIGLIIAGIMIFDQIKSRKPSSLAKSLDRIAEAEMKKQRLLRQRRHQHQQRMARIKPGLGHSSNQMRSRQNLKEGQEGYCSHCGSPTSATQKVRSPLQGRNSRDSLSPSNLHDSVTGSPAMIHSQATQLASMIESAASRKHLRIPNGTSSPVVSQQSPLPAVLH